MWDVCVFAPANATLLDQELMADSGLDYEHTHEMFIQRIYKTGGAAHEGPVDAVEGRRHADHPAELIKNLQHIQE